MNAKLLTRNLQSRIAYPKWWRNSYSYRAKRFAGMVLVPDANWDMDGFRIYFLED